MTDRKPVQLAEVRRAPVPEVVEALRGFLARAEAGEIVGIGIAIVNRDRSTATRYDLGESTVAELHFAAAYLAERLLHAGIER